jgi:hypothetical protein
MTAADTSSMDDALELEPSPRASLRGCLLGARPAVGGLGAGGLKILACSWFAVGLGTLSLLPSDAGAHKTVHITAQSPRAAVGIQTAQRPRQVSSSKRLAASPGRTTRPTPAGNAADAATIDAPGSPRGEGAADVHAAEITASAPANPSAAPAPAVPVKPPVVDATPEPLPLPNDLEEVVPLPLPSTLPIPPLPLPDVGAATSGLPLP